MVNRQRYALYLGLAIMAFHVALTAVLWLITEFPGDRIAVREIATPVTVAYAVAVLKYFVDTHGIVTGKAVMGMPLVIMISGLVIVFMAALVGAPIAYIYVPGMTPSNLNSLFLAVESAFGALMAIVFSYLYNMK